MPYKVAVEVFKDKDTKKVYYRGEHIPSGYPKERIADLLAEDSEGRHAILKGAPIIEEVKTVRRKKAE